MKRVLLLIILLLPFFSYGQFCGYTYHAPISLNGVSNITIQGDSLTSINLTNCSNIHIFKCKIANNTTGAGLAINVYNCSGITIDSCYITNVNQGILVRISTGTKINNNYLKDIYGSPTTTWHPIQLQNCTGGGQSVSYNKIEETLGITNYSHDQISIFQCTGLPGDSIMVLNNWCRFGQRILNGTGPGGRTGANNGACGIVVGDVSGSYQVCRGNLIDGTGYAGIQCIGTNSGITIDHNKIYGASNPVALIGLSYICPAASGMYCGYNQINWRDYNDHVDNLHLGPTTPPGWFTNSPLTVADPAANAGMIPTPMIATCTTPPPPVVTPPNISYTPSSNTFQAGTTISALNVSNTGGAVTSSYTVSPALPANLILNAVSGQISGTPTSATSLAVYVVTASNSGGVSHFNLSLTITPPPVALPVFTYSPNNNIYVIPQTVSLSPVSTGGAIVSYSVTPALPASLSLNTTTGMISGTVSTVSTLTTYTIVGINASGSGRSTVQLTVNPNPIIIPNISYSPATVSATYGIPINSWVPVNLGSAATWTVSPALPLGFGINPSTGVINGVPTTIQGSTNYVVTATNATGSSSFTVSIGIGQHHLTVTALGQQKYLNTANPTLTFDVTGLVNGDQISTALTTPPTLTTSAVQGSPVGNYPITANSAVSTNYSVSYQDGTLSVIPSNNAIRFRVFGGIVPIP